MIDSITIAIPATKNNITSFDNYYGITAENLENMFYNQDINPGNKSIKKLFPRRYFEQYIPEVSLYFMQASIKIVITFSVPKLYFNNNLYELIDSDKYGVIHVLKSRLTLLDINLSTEEILSAEIWKVEIGKNIFLNNISCTRVLKALNEMSFYKKLQSQKTEFRDEYKTQKKYQAGHMFSLWSKKHELCFYNKIAEIKKDKQGVKFLQNLNLSNRQVLRVEYRLFKKSIITQTFIENGFNKTATFNNIFDTNLCKTILVNKWQNIVQKRIGQLKVIYQDTDAIIDAFFKGQKKPSEALNAMGLKSILNKNYSLTEIIQKIPNNYQYYIKKAIATIEDCEKIKKLSMKKSAKENTEKSSTRNTLIPAFNYIYKTLSNYNPIRPNTVI